MKRTGDAKISPKDKLSKCEDTTKMKLLKKQHDLIIENTKLDENFFNDSYSIMNNISRLNERQLQIQSELEKLDNSIQKIMNN
jgi:hypothetical protein